MTTHNKDAQMLPLTTIGKVLGPIRILVADDGQLARKRLARLLADLPAIELSATDRNPRSSEIRSWFGVGSGKTSGCLTSAKYAIIIASIESVLAFFPVTALFEPVG